MKSLLLFLVTNLIILYLWYNMCYVPDLEKELKPHYVITNSDNFLPYYYMADTIKFDSTLGHIQFRDLKLEKNIIIKNYSIKVKE